MAALRYRLALDLGSTSLGWAMIRLNAENQPCAVIKAGVRIFSDGRNPKDGSSLAVTRRDARSMRRRRDQIDTELASQMHATGCTCGGVLHRANFPRKPRACPQEVRRAFESRFSFCCSRCRKRSTSKSARFLGRRVYVALAVVLLPQRRATLSAAAVQLCDTLDVPARTIARWRQWGLQRFTTTTLWQEICARFMPPVHIADLPTSLVGRFTGAAHEAMARLLGLLGPLSVHT